MTNYNILNCPNCGGSGCPTCQNTGKVRVATDQLQKLKSLTNQLSSTNNSLGVNTPKSSNFSQNLPGEYQGKLKFNKNIAGIITFSVLSAISAGATASWIFLKSLKPFLSSLVTLIVSIFAFFAWHHPFFQEKEPNDFLSAIKN